MTFLPPNSLLTLALLRSMTVPSLQRIAPAGLNFCSWRRDRTPSGFAHPPQGSRALARDGGKGVLGRRDDLDAGLHVLIRQYTRLQHRAAPALSLKIAVSLTNALPILPPL